MVAILLPTLFTQLVQWCLGVATLWRFLVLMLSVAWSGRRWWVLTHPSHHRKKKKRVKVLIVLGTGGHTTEMFLMTRNLLANRFIPVFLFVDQRDCEAARDKEKEFRDATLDTNDQTRFIKVRRIRRPNEPILSAIGNILPSVWHALKLMWELQPDVLLLNGPGNCLPIWAAALVFNSFGFGCPIVFVESLCRVNSLSITGQALFYTSTKYCVHWKSLKSKCRQDVVCLEDRFTQQNLLAVQKNSKPAQKNSKPAPNHLLVTVGSTNFDKLIEKLEELHSDFESFLKEYDFRSATIQVGPTSKFVEAGTRSLKDRVLSNLQAIEMIKVEVFVKDFEKEVSKAALIVGHAGAGTIVDALSAGKKLVIVENTDLQDGHQKELIDAINANEKEKRCHASSVEKVVADLKEGEWVESIQNPTLPPHLHPENDDFVKILEDVVGKVEQLKIE